MKLRRRIAGLLALMALVFSFAETARAAVCDGSEAMASHAQHPAPGHAPTQHDSMPQCPLGLAWQSGCAPSASLPAQYAVELATPAAAQSLAFIDIVIPHALRTSVIFHPPRF